MQDASTIVSTVGVECGTLHLAKGEVSVWDFAGQMEYTATHSFFLTVEVFFSVIVMVKTCCCWFPILVC